MNGKWWMNWLWLGLFGLVSLHVSGQSFTKHTLTLKGKKRTYFLYVPKGIKKGEKRPVVIAYHGFESDPGGLRWLISPDKLADEFQYLVVYPSAENKSWNAGRGFGSRNKSSDDLSFASALVDVITARHPVDKNRIYAMGFSNGAQMVALMVCKMPGKIAAAAMVAHTMNIPNCNPKLKVPILMIHGAKDKLAPFAGGGKSAILSHKDSVTFFKKVNEVSNKSKAIVNKPTVKCTRFPGEKTEVVDCVCFNDGHSWPGGREFKTDIFGTTNKELNANRFIFNFFKRYKGKAPNRKNQKQIDSGLKPAPKKPPKSKKQTSKTAKKKTDPKKKGASKKKAAPKKAAPAKKPKIALTEGKLKLGKTTHRYFVHAPEVLQGTWQGVVVVVGPESFNAFQLATMFRTEYYAVKKRLLYLFPKTKPGAVKQNSNAWLYPVVNHAKKTYQVEAPEVYLIGYGNTGRLVQNSFCNDASWITAVSLIHYGWLKEPCPAVPFLPIFMVAGKKNPFVPFKGASKSNTMGQVSWRKNILEQWQGNVFETDLERTKTYRLRQWLTADGALELLFMQTEWGGHGIPGSKYPFPKKYGKTFSGADVIQQLMAFFERHPHHQFGNAHDR